ncbi:MAG: sulfotransferase [Candidatus Omnitrophica bacterium]|nr:sulfotransferase [Candidatus Omnitrophota bacterium]
MGHKKSLAPVVISGAKRSGTTLLQYLFDSVPKVHTLLEESYFLEYLYDIEGWGLEHFLKLQKYAPLDELVTGSIKRSLFHVFEDGYAPKGTINMQHIDIRYDMERLSKSLEEDRILLDGTVKSVWDMWVRAMIRARGYDEAAFDFAVVKSPDYGKSALMALKYLDSSKVIIVVRNPLYAIDSLKKSRQLRREKELHAFELLRVTADYDLLKRSMMLIDRSGLSGRVMVIQYEHLVSTPEETMKKVAAFLGMAFDPSMCKPTLNGKDWNGESSFETFKGISNSPLKRGITTLSKWEVAFVKEALKDFCSYFGYTEEKDNKSGQGPDIRD